MSCCDKRNLNAISTQKLVIKMAETGKQRNIKKKKSNDWVNAWKSIGKLWWSQLHVQCIWYSKSREITKKTTFNFRLSLEEDLLSIWSKKSFSN